MVVKREKGSQKKSLKDLIDFEEIISSNQVLSKSVLTKKLITKLNIKLKGYKSFKKKAK